MQRLRSLPIWIGISSCAFMIGCVSINLGPGKGEKSRGVTYAAPAAPFQPLENKRADGAWQNKSNGNSISYLSTCNDPTDPSLESVTQDLFSGLSDLKIVTNYSRTFNGRDALESEVEGQLDGVPTRISSIVFKKNNCLYTLSYIGVARFFAEDKDKFEEFKKSFEAP